MPDFVPSRQQLTAFMFFDQYAQSLTPWSPDGRSLLIFGKLGYYEERSPLSDDESKPRHSAGRGGRAAANRAGGGFDWLLGSDCVDRFTGCAVFRRMFQDASSAS